MSKVGRKIYLIWVLKTPNTENADKIKLGECYVYTGVYYIFRDIPWFCQETLRLCAHELIKYVYVIVERGSWDDISSNESLKEELISNY